MDVYELMLVRTDGTLGPNVTRVNRACPQIPEKPEERCGTSEAVGTYRAIGLRWETKAFVDFLERVAQRPVLDRTGLSGQFDLSIAFQPEHPAASGGENGSDAGGAGGTADHFHRPARAIRTPAGACDGTCRRDRDRFGAAAYA